MTERSELSAWFEARIPSEWFEGPPGLEVDGDEIIVVGRLAPAGKGESAASPEARIRDFREASREQRIRIAEEGQRKFRRKVSWAVEEGGIQKVFTTLSLPVMTRLRQSERRVLDTLIGAGVARSRSEALNWCVRLVAERQADWLKDLDSALEGVEKARSKGPRV